MPNIALTLTTVTVTGGTNAANIGVQVPISAALSGTGSLSATLDVVSSVVEIEAALSGTGSLSASVAVASPVEAAITGAGALAADVAISPPIAAALTGTGAAAGDLAMNTPVAASLTGTGALAADVDIDEYVGGAAPAPVVAGVRLGGITDYASWVPALWRPRQPKIEIINLSITADVVTVDSLYSVIRNPSVEIVARQPSMEMRKRVFRLPDINCRVQRARLSAGMQHWRFLARASVPPIPIQHEEVLLVLGAVDKQS